jgi:hypothetical protein
MTIARKPLPPKKPLPPLEVLQERFEEREPGVLRHRRDVIGGGFHGNNLVVAKAGNVAGSKNSEGYWVIGVERETYNRSRLIWKLHHGADPLGAIDHGNGVRDDDRIENLQDVPDGINSRNMLWRDGSSYVHGRECCKTYDQVVGFTILCWPDEDHEGLAVRLDALIKPRIDQVYANRLGRQRPGAKRKAPGPIPFSSQELLELFEEREGVLYWQSGAKAGNVAGYRHVTGYWIVIIQGAQLRRSHLIWKIYHDRDPLGVIDHRNRDRSDDRIENLRDVSYGINSRNVGWRDGSSYVICIQDGRDWGWTVRFDIGCWPDENPEQLAADLHELIAPEFDAIYAGRVGRQKPAAVLEAAE